MKLEDFQAITNQIAQNLGNQGLVTELLTKIIDDYKEVSTVQETLQASQIEASEKIQKLQETNMNLFLKVGNPTPTEKLNTTEPLTYDALLGELGGDK